MKRRNKTAGELNAELRSDPAFIAREQQREQQRAREIEEIRIAAAPVIANLAERGFHVSRISELLELLRGGTSYANAVPVLLNWLPAVSHRDVKLAIVQTLSVPFAKSAAPLLIEEFRRASVDEDPLKWAIGNALAVVADDEVFQGVAQLARDRRHGSAREMLAVALGNMSTASAVDVLLELLKDDEVAGHAIIALGKLKARSAREAIQGFLGHPKPWIRKEASKALAKIDRVGARSGNT